MRRSFVAALALIGIFIGLAAFWGAFKSRPPGFASSAGIATIEFLDVGQGDAILVRSPEGKTALIDAGPSNRIVEQLRDRDVRSIDLVVVSHHHLDHYGGMAAVLKAFHPRAFLDADTPHLTPTYLALLKRVKAEKMTALRAGDKPRTIALGSVNLKVFPLGPVDSKNENNNSIGIRVEFGRFSALLTGDSEGPERRWWARNASSLGGDVDVLKLAHHGARDGTSASWLALTRPKLAVASMAAKNDFGHPHREVLELLRARSIPLLRTDQAGSIFLKTDGRAYEIERSKRPPTRSGASLVVH